MYTTDLPRRNGWKVGTTVHHISLVRIILMIILSFCFYISRPSRLISLVFVSAGLSPCVTFCFTTPPLMR